MLDRQVTDGLRALKLSGMADEFERQQQTMSSASQPASDRIMQLIHAENDARTDRRRKRLLLSSGLNASIAPEDLNLASDRGLDPTMINEMLTCNWIRQANNATIVGATGGGKTFVATALGRAAIRQGLSVGYRRTHLLLEDIAVARLDGTIRKMRQQLCKLNLIILDEFGLHALDEQAKEDLLDILEDRVGSSSTVVVGQRAVNEWHDFIDRPLLADALLDRILCRAYNIEIKGRSLRNRKPAPT